MQNKLDYPGDGATSLGVEGNGPRRFRVLLVEDEDMVRKVVRIFLSYEGHEIMVAESENEAISIAEAERGTIDVLLADVRLGQGSGPGTAIRLRESHPETKVIFMSGFPKDHLIANGMLSLGDRFLPKPFDTKTFRAALREVGVREVGDWTPKGSER